jgi:hypothetical protein
VPLLDRIAELPLDADPAGRMAQAKQAMEAHSPEIPNERPWEKRHGTVMGTVHPQV